MRFMENLAAQKRFTAVPIRASGSVYQMNRPSNKFNGF